MTDVGWPLSGGEPGTGGREGMSQIAKIEYVPSIEFSRGGQGLSLVETKTDGSAGHYDYLSKKEALAAFEDWLNGKSWRRR